QAHDAGDWEFKVFGMRGWEAKMIVRGTSALRFSVPLLYVEEHPTAFQAMFVSFAKRLKAIHGYGGHGLVLSAVRVSDNQPFEAFLAEKLHGLDVGHPVAGSTHAHKGIKTVSWLTALNHELVEKIGGIGEIQAELPMDWFALYDYGSGVVIQSGPTPEAAPTDQPKPARLVLPNRLFKEIRAPKFSLHYASRDGEPLRFRAGHPVRAYTGSRADRSTKARPVGIAEQIIQRNPCPKVQPALRLQGRRATHHRLGRRTMAQTLRYRRG
ncbi:hypothetical protein A259_22894, partial [Pseudomonas syringae pv. actinidiae ICMP 19070]